MRQLPSLRVRDAKWTCVLPLFAAALVGCAGTNEPKFGPPAELIKSAEIPAGTAGSTLATRPSVRVRDASERPVPGVSVAFAVTRGGGTVLGATQTTDADGEARVDGWTLGNVAGTNTLTATVAGLPPATFDVAGEPGPPAKLVFTQQPTSTGPLLRFFPAVSVSIADQFNNVVPTATNTVALSISNLFHSATISGAGPSGPTAGVVVFPDLMLDKAGSYSVTASSPPLLSTTSVPFTIASSSSLVTTFVVALATVGESVFFITPNAGAEPNSLRRVSTFGGAVTTIASGVERGGRIVSDGTNLYWMELGPSPSTITGRINRMPLAGGPVTTIVNGLSDMPHHSLMLVGSTLFFTARSPASGVPAILTVAANAPANSQPTEFMTFGFNPAFTIDGGHAYVSDLSTGSMYRVPVSGGSPIQIASDIPAAGVRGGYMIVLGTTLYWSDFSAVYFLQNITGAGGPVQTLVASNGSGTLDFSTDGTYVYFGNNSTGLRRYDPATAVFTFLANSTPGSGLGFDSQSIYYYSGSSILKIAR